MSTITKERRAKQTLLEPDDVGQLTRREELKLELCKLNAYLKPRISATIHKFGTGKVMIGDNLVELKRSVRQNVAWKPLCYSQLDEAVIDAVKESFAEPTNVDSAMVLK